ncbi:MAG: hypothetical protein MZV63_37210 [Marinilabiliales bacterium]|nr:hypothetical protein [Marinilabiliales bacterium]
MIIVSIYFGISAKTVPFPGSLSLYSSYLKLAIESIVGHVFAWITPHLILALKKVVGVLRGPQVPAG